jgi:hypothetical protein
LQNQVKDNRSRDRGRGHNSRLDNIAWQQQRHRRGGQLTSRSPAVRRKHQVQLAASPLSTTLKLFPKLATGNRL